MPTLQKIDNAAIVSVPTSNKRIEELLSKEWLLTNSRGGFSSSTIAGCNTRRYHGLLIGSLNPPVNRIMALANCLEMIIHDGKVTYLSTFEFGDKFAPAGFGCVKQFRRDIGVHFDCRTERCELTKSVYLMRDADVVAVVYEFTNVDEPVNFAMRPFIGLRDFHTLQKSYAPLCAKWANDGLLVRHNVPVSCELFLSCPSMSFEKDEQWWFNFIYRVERERGQDFTEDLWTPGFFKCQIKSPTQIVLWGSFSGRYEAERAAEFDIERMCRDLYRHQNMTVAAAKTRDDKFRTLCLAGDQFVTKRRTTGEDYRTTILAGFPWFADWGRDAFISLPGLLLATGRFNEAKSVLTTFAQAADEGMIPNRFDDYGGAAYFNSIDASLWFVNAAFQYLNATDDSETFTQQLLPIIRWIVDSYHNGTRFGIHADKDGLITGGSEDTQLTWMDAKYEKMAFTPRYGKAVEVNALWYNALCGLAQFYTERDIGAAKRYRAMAEEVEGSFCELFWNKETGCLNDCILPDGTIDASIRPNQIFAASLPFSPLQPDRQKAVVEVVSEELLTPYGLRTLSPRDRRYKSMYIGSQRYRDEAYHQGTVWPYLIGPFVEAYLKVNDFSRKSKERAAEFIEPLMRYLTEDGCLGSVSEIFDGDAPHRPRGCIAQAWSVAELIRAYQLTHS